MTPNQQCQSTNWKKHGVETITAKDEQLNIQQLWLLVAVKYWLTQAVSHSGCEWRRWASWCRRLQCRLVMKMPPTAVMPVCLISVDVCLQYERQTERVSEPFSTSAGCRCRLEMKMPTTCDRFAPNNLATFTTQATAIHTQQQPTNQHH